MVETPDAESPEPTAFALLPATGYTVPPVMVTLANPLYPPPMPAPCCPPCARTMPPEMLMSPDCSVVCAPPMPAAFAPPMAVTMPPLMLIVPDCFCEVDPPMPAAFLPPCAMRAPEPVMLSVRDLYTAMPGQSAPLTRLFVPSIVRSSVAPSAIQRAALFFQLETFSLRSEIVSLELHLMSMPAFPWPVTTWGPALVMMSDACVPSLTPPSDPESSAYHPLPFRCAMSSPSISTCSG